MLRQQGKPNHAAKFTDMAVREKTQLEYKRGVTKKPANEFVRSSEAQQVPKSDLLFSVFCAQLCVFTKKAGLCILAS